jgi:hypothetical protein
MNRPQRHVTLATATIVGRRGTRDGDRGPSGDEHGNP